MTTAIGTASERIWRAHPAAVAVLAITIVGGVAFFSFLTVFFVVRWPGLLSWLLAIGLAAVWVPCMWMTAAVTWHAATSCVRITPTTFDVSMCESLMRFAFFSPPVVSRNRLPISDIRAIETHQEATRLFGIPMVSRLY